MRIFYFAIAILLSTSGCEIPKYVYGPTTMNAPFFTEKNQSKIGINYVGHGSEAYTRDSASSRGRDNGFDFQAAYALTNHWFVHGTYASRSENLSPTTSRANPYFEIIYNRNYAEGGIGYTNGISSDSIFYIQAQLGYGQGKSDFTEFDNTRSSTVDRFHKNEVDKYYLLVSPQVMVKNFRIQLPQRITYLRFNNIETNYSSSELERNYLAGLDVHNPLLYETGLNINLNFTKLPQLRFDGQLGGSFKLSKDNYLIRRKNFFASIGTSIDIVGLFKK